MPPLGLANGCWILSNTDSFASATLPLIPWIVLQPSDPISGMGGAQRVLTGSAVFSCSAKLSRVWTSKCGRSYSRRVSRRVKQKRAILRIPFAMKKAASSLFSPYRMRRRCSYRRRPDARMTPAR